MDVRTRVKNILTRPAREWQVIAGEAASVNGLLRDYAAPVSGLAAICRWLGLNLFFGVLGVGFLATAISGVIAWALGLVGAWVAAIAIERLAPSFSSRGGPPQALKLVVYASTPVWIASMLSLVPLLAPLVILGAIYAVYLFYLGLPVVMETPPDKVVPFMAASAVVVFVAVMLVRTAANILAGV
jgi:hypothetical protein